MRETSRYAPIALLLALLLFNACNSGEKKAEPSNYFDLKTYFAEESARLNKNNPSVHKTVSIDGSSEEKQLTIEDWTKELAAFSDADINKAAWRGSFNLEKKNAEERYTPKGEDIPVRLLVIKRKAEKINSIHIEIRNKNPLYTSVDELNYYPDSVYEITKTQAIKLKEPKTYEVRGVFTNAATPPPAQTSTAPLP